MLFELPLADNIEWSPQLANPTLVCVSDISISAPELLTELYIYNICSRATQAQICRAFIAVYQWVVYLGPSLARQLMQIHCIEGATGLTKLFPDLVSLVDHIVAFVKSHQAQQNLRQVKCKPRRKKQKVGEPVALPETIGAVNASASPLEDLSRMPGDFFGLLPKAKATVSLKPLGKAKIANDGALYDVAVRVLCLVWDEQLVLKHMKKVDSHIYAKERSYDSEAIRDRCTTRSAVLGM
ncbi:hypothetical protein B0H14DRAFT_2419297 [Mycena olivaceomarginata]|nr:hypothetical protein B0H14DRAFT_2419297 [Mycena olivaceomarginata]